MTVKQHRRLGPIAAFLAIAGYLAGISLVLFDKGSVYEYPLHLAVGSAMLASLVTTVVLSRMIKGTLQSIRTWHFRFGIVTLGLLIIEAILGLDILL